jgi:broad specificity phosphatase PhoE
LATLYLIRHARPAGSFGDSVDPGLDEVGKSQVEQVADLIARQTRSLPVYTSPLRRCRETAQPLAAIWGVQPIIFDEAGEIPSPPLSLAGRQSWLRKAMGGTWAELKQTAPDGSPDFDAWRTTLVSAISAIAGDSVIYSHFIAINAIIGAAQGIEQVVSFRPDHASVTTVDVGEGQITVRALGRETSEGRGSAVLPGR